TIGPMSERFAHLIKLQDLKSKLTSAFRPPPENGIPFREDLTPEEQIEKIASKSDMPPTHVKPKREKPEDVYYEDSTYEATSSGQEATTSAKPPHYSDNALKYGLSAGIRLDTLWPQAIAAFKRNPLLGTGYSTLVKSRVWEQTPAESTDNDYLRLLGETGLLGFVSFLSIFGICAFVLYKAFVKSSDPFYTGLFAAGLGLIAGLLANALYIDIFESSKVAYFFWSIMGVLIATSMIVLKEKDKAKKK
ncbi:MAG: O-antigen ligase family protein, partial [Patescibacteria group bacterium]